MESFHWVRHRCRQLTGADRTRGRYSAPEEPPSKRQKKRRLVFPRLGPLHNQDANDFSDNSIRTTKYNLWTFVPMNLFQQFHRAANLYFLFLALLNWVPVVEAFQKEITMIPLVVVLAVTACKDALEDYRRYLFDRRVNNSKALVYNGEQKDYVQQRWRDVRVGDFVRLSCNEIIPADLLLLYSSDPGGVCYIETANLDGETNLKQRQVVSELHVEGEDFSPESFCSHVVCETPNNNLGRFSGYMENPNGACVGLHKNNLLLRSCTLRNTKTVVGLVVYAGHETKAMMNNSGPRYKRSLLERRLNIDVLWCVLLLVVMCLTASIGHGLWLLQFNNPVYLVDQDTPPALAGFYVFWTMIIVLQVLIPISLYVSIEIVKLGQVYFIQNDLQLYNQQLDSRIQCRALNITEDLGQIQYLFSDKTGTLTENKMVFRRCSIFGVEYSHRDNACRLDMYEAEERKGGTLKSVGSRRTTSCASLRCSRSSESQHGFAAESPDEDVQQTTSNFCSSMEVLPDPELLRKLSFLRAPGTDAPDAPSVQELSFITDFFLALTICNTVVVSSGSQAPHTVPEGHTPLKSLEEIKQLFQRFSFSPPFISSANALETRNSPRTFTKRLFGRGGTASFSTPPTSTTEISVVGQEGPQDASNLNLEEESSVTAVSMDGGAEGRGPDPDFLRTQGDLQEGPEELLYEAESPDEAALVHAARAYQCTLRARSVEHLLVDLPGFGPVVVPLLHIIPFDSNRKRMSVVVRHPLTGEVVVYTKGADSVIMDLAEDLQGADAAELHARIRDQTQKHLDGYAREGLRTLCIAKKVLDGKQYEMWLEKQLQAEKSIENRDQLMLESAERLETNLTLLGSTGIVDRLQEEVPETIEALQRAGIKVWVLTGDKQETAVNIAYACRLVRAIDRLLTANCGSREACAVFLDRLLQEVDQGLDGAPESCSDGAAGFILVIDGRTLGWALQEDLQSSFLDLCRRCRAVICCRSTPLQKSQVVRLVRDHLKVMTLAIGDGANDVSMIQVADVGVGISGQEGMQAVMSSDFAISRFRHLSRLLLVHGRWCFSRLRNMILYFIYKNVMYVNLLFWYQFFCGFSGAVMTNSWVLIFFNLFFTSVPPLVYGVLDKDTPEEVLTELPELYSNTHNSKVRALVVFWVTVLDAFYQSLVCFFVPYFVYAGSDVAVLSFGSPINASALFIILLHQVLESHTLTWIHLLVLLLSAASYFFFVLLFSGFCVTCSPPTNPVGVELLAMRHPLFYLVCVLTTVAALIPRLLVRAVLNSVGRTAERSSSSPPGVEETSTLEPQTLKNSGITNQC
ncbi:phospholipid-transporting ATPase VD isoform 1-T1 [Synchiropus picturatus]